MTNLKTLASAVALTFVAGTATASTISYADAVASFDLGTSNRTILLDDPTAALGAPDYVKGSGYVSLGFGGSLTLEFTKSFFTGSGNADDDLIINEIGPLSEGTNIAISSDGVNFFDVGTSGIGNEYGIDIDAFGFGVSDTFSFVRITDDSNGGSGGRYAGADIDSVAAINSVPAVPLPAAGWLMLGALGGLAAVKRRKS